MPRPLQLSLADGSIVDASGYSDDQMFDLGFYRWVPTNEEYDPKYQIQLAPTITVKRGAVMASYNNIFRDIAELQSIRGQEVNDFRERWAYAGWVYNGVRYDSDNTARQNMSGTMTLINSGYTLPDDFTWRSQDNADHPFTTNEFKAFFAASCMWAEMVYRVSWTHKTNLLRISDPQKIVSYDITLGWPVDYALPAQA